MEGQAGLWTLVLLGLVSGIISGLFGVGGGIIIVPALVFLLGYSQHRAVGTSLAVLLPPVGLAAVLGYYRQGNVDVRAAMVIALTMLVGGGIGAHIASRLSGPILRLAFGVFAVILGVNMVYNAVKRL